MWLADILTDAISALYMPSYFVNAEYIFWNDHFTYFFPITKQYRRFSVQTEAPKEIIVRHKGT